MVDADKKILRVKQTIRKNVVKEYKPFIEQLFGYFNGEINHTLDGYVCKVLETLLKKHPVKVIQYIFRSKIYKSMLKHGESFSVCEFMVNVLLSNAGESEFSRQELLAMILKIILNPAIEPIPAKVRMP